MSEPSQDLDQAELRIKLTPLQLSAILKASDAEGMDTIDFVVLAAMARSERILNKDINEGWGGRNTNPQPW